MCDSQVIGCQLLACWPNPQSNPWTVKPARTCGLLVTYSGSSYSRKSSRSEGRYSTSVIRPRARQIRFLRRSFGACSFTAFECGEPQSQFNGKFDKFETITPCISISWQHNPNGIQS